MPNATDKDVLDYIADNPTDERAGPVMQKWGIDATELEVWKHVKDNPDHPQATAVKNKLFEKIANSQPAANEQGVSVGQRMTIKNLINDEPGLIQKYLEKKGYKTRAVSGEYEASQPQDMAFGVHHEPQKKPDRIEVLAPGATQWSQIDPDGIDFWDLTDVLGDLHEATASAVATSQKVLGGLGAPLTGGASLAIGSAAGAATMASAEEKKQTLAKAVGARDEYDFSKMGEKAFTGAVVPVITKLGGKALEWLGIGTGGLAKAVGAVPKQNADEIAAAAKTLGAEATPGMLIDSPAVQARESVLSQMRGKLGGARLRTTIDKNRKAVDAAADDIVKGASGRTAFESGSMAETQVIDKIVKKLEPAEAIYKKYEDQYANTFVKRGALDEALKQLEQEMATSPSFSRVKAFRDAVDRMDTLAQLKMFKTNMGRISKGFNEDEKYIAAKLTQAANVARNDTILGIAQQADQIPMRFSGEAVLKAPVTKTGTGISVPTGTTKLAPPSKSGGSPMLKEILEADKIWREAAEEIEQTLLKRGDKVSGGVKATAEEFFEKTPEIERISKLMNTTDPKRIAEIRKAYPEAFAELKAAKIAEIAKRGDTPAKLSKILNDMPPESLNLLFDEDQVLKAKALKVYLDAIPEKVGPSGTPAGIEMFTEFFDPRFWLGQVNSLSKSALQSLITNPALGRDIFTKAGKALQTPGGAAATTIGIEQRPKEPKPGSQYYWVPTDKK